MAQPESSTIIGVNALLEAESLFSVLPAQLAPGEVGINTVDLAWGVGTALWGAGGRRIFVNWGGFFHSLPFSIIY